MACSAKKHLFVFFLIAFAVPLLFAAQVSAQQALVEATLSYLGGTPGNEIYKYDYKVYNNTLTPGIWAFLVFFDTDGTTFLGDHSDFSSGTAPASWDMNVYADPDPAPWFVEWTNSDGLDPILPGGSLAGFSVTFVWKDLVLIPDVQHFEAMNGEAFSGETIVIRRNDVPNLPPFPPVLAMTPLTCPTDAEDLVVTVTGPSPADPDGDAVTYLYRWLVDTGTGFVDDELAGRGDHSGNIVPGADTQSGDVWRVQVTPVDIHGAHGNYSTATWGAVNGPTATAPVSWGRLKAGYR